MKVYKVVTFTGADTVNVEFVDADYFIMDNELKFYERGEGDGGARKDTLVGQWVPGTFSFVSEYHAHPDAKMEEVDE